YDSESLAITGIRTGAESGSGTSGSVGSALTGTYGQLTIAADGSYEYVANQNAADTLDPGETATDTFTYTVKDDDNKNADTGEIVITVTGINDDITAVNDTDAVNAGATISRSESDAQELDQDDTDDDGDDVPGAFTITAIRTGATEGSGTAKTIGQAFTTTYGTLTVNANGTYTYAADQNGSTSLSNGATATDSFNYTVRDHASGDTDDATLVITITGTNNNAPVASNDTGYILEDGTLTVGDGGSAVTGSDSNNNNESGDTTGDVLVGDTDADGDTLTVSAISGGSVGSAVTGTYGTLTIQSNGSYEYVADQSAADTLDAGDTVTDVFTYTVSDGNDGTDTATLTFTILGVDDNPVGVNDTGYINEDATLTVNDGGSAVTGSDSNNNNESADTTGDVLANDTDADGSSSLTVSAISGGTVGQALTGTYGTLTLNANGSYTYVANQSGADGLATDATATDTFTYTVSDGAGTTDTATLTITVKGVGPTATNDTGSVNEDATLSVNSGSGVTSNDTGGDTESLEVTNIRTGTESGSGTSGSVGTALTGTYGELTINADGSYTYVANQNAADALDPGETATDTFTYTVKDDDNKNADIGEIVITVTGVNDEIIAVDDTDSVNEDATISRSTSDAQELDADDTDADGDDVPGAFTITAIRTGSESGSGTSGTIGQALTGTYGTLTVNADGSYTYVADQNAADSIVTGQTATDTFTYTVRDHSSGDTDTAELVFTVTGINDENPVAVDDTDSVNRDATIERAAGSSFDINADDTDADGDSLTITGIRVGQTEGGGASGTVGSELVGTYGTLTLNSDGSYTYTADQDAANSLKRGDSAIDYFNYTVSDGTNEDIGVIAITINGISDPPVPVDDTLAIDASAQTTKNSSSGVLVNDTDPDGDTITVDSIRTGQESGTGTTGTVGSVITGTYGDLTINSDGSYTYQANNAKSVNPGDTVTDYFTYTATDSETSVPAQISITVTGINDPPEVISPINVPTLITDQNVVIKYTQAFDDPDSGSYDITEYKVIDPESEQETSLPTGLYIEGNKLKGKIKTPGDYSITLRAIDGAGLYVDHTFTIKVIPSPADISETVENEKPVKLKTV
ncbi:Ig-like domain-containing protein, partial [Pelagibacteraceae bacterium]|nr:Ig-like domain-containing protein [Pelagibacteraceae bacterium]